MMKEYKYCQSVPCSSIDVIGERFTLYEGDNITTWDGKTFCFNGHRFALDRERLKGMFKRVYTVEHLNRYERIRENAMIAAMQSLITNLKDVRASMDMHEVENVAKNAIWFANSLVDELMEKEF